MVNFFIDLNYFSLYDQRLIIVHGSNFTLKGDLINNSVEIFKQNRKKLKKYKINKNYTYVEQHKSLLNNNYLDACSYKEGAKLMSLFDQIKNFNK